MRGLVAVSLLLAVMVAGCSKYRFHPHAGVAVIPEPEDCTFHVVEHWPYPGYEEVGVLEVAKGLGPARDYNEFWHDVRSLVCEAGGEVVIPQINGLGWYMRGIVLRRQPGTVPPPAPGPPPASAGRAPGETRYRFVEAG